MKCTTIFMRMLFLIIFSIGIVSSAISQTSTLKGSVLDEKKNAIAGATVKVKGTNTTRVTDNNGNFTIPISGLKQTLIVSFIGYETNEILLGSGESVSVILRTTTNSLDNVVVNALGFETRKDRLGYATNRINANAINNSSEAGLLNALAGKSSGVRVSRTSGDPGGASQILIRGQSTITRSTDPLIVLDGVPISGDARNESSGGQIVQQSRLNDINPDDIANAQILKGASAAALWGTRAANGVIIITTKKGNTGLKPSISFRSTVSFDQVSAFYNLQSAYGQGNNGVWAANAIRSWGDKISKRSGSSNVFNTTGGYFVSNSGSTIYPITSKNSKEIFKDKNYDAIFRTGQFLDNSISISGGDAKSNYYVSISDLNQKGVARNSSDYRRTSFRVNASRQLNSWLNISNKTAYILTNSNRLQSGINNAGLLIGLLRTPPDFDNTDYIGNYYSSSGGAFVANRQRSYRNAFGASTNPGFNNPLWVINSLQNTSRVNRFINSAEINIKPAQWFTLTTRAGVDFFTDQQTNYFPYFTANANTGRYDRDEYSEFQFNLDVIARATHDFSDMLSGNMVLGFNYNSLKTSNLGGQALNFILPNGSRDFNNVTPANLTVTDSYLNRLTNAGYSSIGMAWNNQFFVNVTGRLEAASTFGQLAKKAFFYPSTDIAWQFTQLEKLQSAKWLSFGKLRASMGIVGVQPQAYQTATNYVTRTWVDGLGGALDPSLYGTGSYIQSVNKGNPFLRPERKQEIEAGIDLRFLNNKLSFSISAYSNETVDALISVTQSPASGYNTFYTNAGTIENKGVEIDLGYNVLAKNDWTLDVNLNWTRNKNLVTNLSGAGSITLGGSAGVSSRAVEGYPLGILYSNVFQKDATGKRILNANGFPTVDPTAVPIGDPNADWRAAFGFNLKYKKLYLNALLEHSQGGQVINGTDAVLLDYGTSATVGFERTATKDLKRYNGTTIAAGTPFRGNIGNFGAGDVALDQSWYTGPGGWFGNVGENFLEDATWTRFREINLGYNISSNYLKKKLGLSSIGLELSGRNLFIISKVSGYDPDANVSGSGSGRGVIYFVNPPTKSFLFTLKLNF